MKTIPAKRKTKPADYAFFILIIFLIAWPGTLARVASAQAAPDPSPQPGAALDPSGAQWQSSQWQTLGSITSVERLPDGVEMRSQKGALRVSVLSDYVVRVQLAPGGKVPVDNSWAVLPDAVAAMKTSSPVEIHDNPAAVELTTAELTVRVEKPAGRVIFMDRSGKVISEDDPQRPPVYNSVHLSPAPVESSFTAPETSNLKTATEFRLWKVMPEDEHYFGLGDKPGPMDHRNQAFTMWNTDAYGWQDSTDPLYKTIPFFVAMRKGASYGIFFDNTFRSYFDFGKSHRDAFSYGADDGPIDYYFIYGPHPKRVIERYTALTGHTPMPPLWTLGFQQSRYSYYPEARVREIANTYRAKQIPLDAIFLDIDYQRGNRPFTVNRELFPHFEGMIKDLARQGIKTVVIDDLHLKKEAGYAPYDTGLQGDHFVKNPDGTVYVGAVWPGPSVFPDFTRGASTREWYGSLYKDFLSQGVKGFWNDMNEPAVFERLDKTMPLDTVHRVAMPDGTVRFADHREIHNVFGMQNVRATYEGLLRINPNLRPFVITRAAYAGTQRYAASWTGDNSSSWEHMRISIPHLLNLGTSGYAAVGADIGGYRGSPLPDVLTRWLELGAFNPIYRDHTEKGSKDQEPWVHGPAHEAIRKKYIELRYKLLPYIYTAFEENTRTGVPVMRAVFLEYPHAEDLVTLDREFFFGPDLLVAPQIWEYYDFVEVILPPGEWYDFWSGERVEGGRMVKRPVGLDTVPVYVRAGAIIPEQPLVQSTDETPQGPLRLRVYMPASGAGGGSKSASTNASKTSAQENASLDDRGCNGALYADDGLTYRFRQGEYKRVAFNCQASPGSLLIRMSEQGNYVPWWKSAQKSVQVTVFGAARAARRVTLGNSEMKSSYDQRARTLTVELPSATLSGELLIQY